MDVYLVRHAIAEQRDPTRWPDDAERPLTREGAERFRSAARGLQRIVSRIDLVLSSPHVRAWQTAELLCEEAAWPAPERCPALGAALRPEDALEVLRGRSEHSSVALVGHEPYLSSLAALLMSGEEGRVRLELKKGGVVLLAFATDPGPGGALLRWSVSPKILRSLAIPR